MDILTKFELKKILQRKSTRVSIIALFLACIIGLVTVVSTESLGSTTTGNLQKGISAISKKKNENKKLSGYLTEEKVSEIITLHNELRIKSKGNDDYSGLDEVQYFGQWEKYMYLDLLINRANSPLNTFDFTTMNKLTSEDGETFYSNRLKQISDFMKTSEYSSKEKEKAMTLVNKMETPLYYNYTFGWKSLLGEMSSFNIFALFVTCICIAPIFSSEYQTGADSIVLPTKYGRNKLIISKFKASFIFTTVLYFSSVTFVALMRLCTYGFTGWNCKIQAYSTYWHSMYNINFLQAFLLSALLGYIACLVSASIVMCISAKLKAPFTVIIVSASIILIPVLIDTDLMPKQVGYFMSLLPINTIDINHILGYYKSYNILGTLILQPWVIIVASIVLIIALLPLTYNIFRKHEVI